ncbi:serine carboxypeptidase-like 47 [Dorcoceras hygrometricum]|uniref:Serine carboxypeptidase-like 47 n=1 Tax=Dorcoceras hygrometricum TaxID=472368 RepID=A0A2Z7BD15_9LAMI|nr:serine carboxypeptidase-like 47 [Dorcoceras hygrometricum]
MVKMFKALESSGLKGFLGCSSVIYEAALVEFLQNASVQDDKVQEMKFEYLLLNDILAKTVIVKASFFDAVTHETFLMMSAIHGGVKDFPPLKILTAKTVGTYVAKNKNITVDMDEPAGDEPVVKKKATSKRRPTPAIGEPVAKKKRTTAGRAATTE